MLKVKVITKDGETKIFTVDSETFEKAKKRVLKLYPNARYIGLVSDDGKKKCID